MNPFERLYSTPKLFECSLGFLHHPPVVPSTTRQLPPQPSTRLSADSTRCFQPTAPFDKIILRWPYPTRSIPWVLGSEPTRLTAQTCPQHYKRPTGLAAWGNFEQQTAGISLVRGYRDRAALTPPIDRHWNSATPSHCWQGSAGQPTKHPS